MNTISAQEIKRHGISVADEALKEGPVQIIKNNRPQYVILTREQYSRLTASSARENSLWDWLERPPRGSCTKEEIDAYLQEQRENWANQR